MPEYVRQCKAGLDSASDSCSAVLRKEGIWCGLYHFPAPGAVGLLLVKGASLDYSIKLSLKEPRERKRKKYLIIDINFSFTN